MIDLNFEKGPTFYRKSVNMIITSTTDYTLINKEINYKLVQEKTNISDHTYLIYDLELINN